jgi:hypothetical protein
MAAVKGPKWTIEQAIDRMRQAKGLIKGDDDILKRLTPPEAELMESGSAQLESHQSGQGEKLVSQKAKTQDQNESSTDLKTRVIDIRKSVQAATDDPGMRKRFGVGEKINSKTVGSVREAANIIINGYNADQEWAQSAAGILDEDIQEIQDLTESLKQVDKTQETAKLTRKVATVEKNVLQRQIEDLVTKISVIGARVCRIKDPAKVALFEGLIPSSGGGVATGEDVAPEAS